MAEQEEQNDKFRKEVLGYLKKQDFGSKRFGPLKSNQQGNENLANILMDIQDKNFEKSNDTLGTLGKELADNLKDLNESALMGDAASQAILLDQLKAYQKMLPLLEENNDEQREAKKRLTMLYSQSSEAMKRNSKFYNRLVEGARSLMPAASGFLTAMTAKSPIAGAMVNFALEKFQARQARKEQAKEAAVKSLMKTFGSMSTSSSPTSPIKVPSGSPNYQDHVNDPEFQKGVEEGIVEELKLLNNQQMEELKVKLTELFDVTTEELDSIERIAQFLAPIASDEAQMEAEKQMDEQNIILRSIAEGVNKSEEKKESGGLFGQFGDWKAMLDVLKGAALALFTKVKVLGKLFMRWAIPLTLAVGIGKGLYDGVKKWMNGGTFAEALATGLTSAGDLLLNVFTLGYAKEVKEWFSQKGTDILDPIFGAYDSIALFVSDTMDDIEGAVKSVTKTIGKVIGDAKKFFSDIQELGLVGALENMYGPKGGSQNVAGASDKPLRLPGQEERMERAMENKARIAQEIKANASPLPAGATRAGGRGNTASMRAEVAPSAQGGTSGAPVTATSPISMKGIQSDFIKSLAGQGITDPTEVANVMAQVQGESGFRPRSEELDKYSPETLFKLFGAGNAGGNKVRFNSLEDAKSLVAQGPEAVGNTIYGGRMGNAPDEGFKYRGRGLVQLTGKANYEEMSKKLGIDLVNNPDLANDPAIASQIAASYFGDKKRSGVDMGNIAEVGKAVGYAGGAEETAKRANMARGFESQLMMEGSAELATDTVPKAESNMNILESATGQVKAAETASRAQVESRNSTVNVKNTNIAGSSGGSGAPTGGTAGNNPRHVDPTIEKFSYALV